MGELLISIVAIHEIPSSVFSSIINTAYEAGEKLNSPATLLLLDADTKEAIKGYTRDSVTRPPVDDSFISPFVGWSIDQVAGFLLQNAKGTLVDNALFLVADEQTGEDQDTLLLVAIAKRGIGSAEFDLKTVRVSAEFANTEAVAVSVATKDLNELVSLADDDGVYRGGSDGIPRQPPKKGGSAPRKQL